MKHCFLHVLALTLVSGVVLHRAAAQAQVDADSSLAAAVYLERGLPAIDRPWITQDYVAAQRVLSALPEDQLPRTTSRKSAAVIDRVTDPRNLSFFKNKSLPIKPRFGGLLDFFDAVRAISKIYVAAQPRNALFNEDIIRINGFMLQMIAVQLDLTNEFVPTLDRNDPSFGARMSGLKQLKLSLAEVVQGALTMLEERSAYSAGARARFASILAASLPKIARSLPPLSAIEFKNTLHRVAKEEQDVAIKAALTKATAM